MDSVLLAYTATLTAPLLLAALGGLLSERSGIINIALEGMMLSAACLAAVVGVVTGSALLGLLAGVLASVLLGLLHTLLTQAYRIDHIVSGMAINALAFGGTNFLFRSTSMAGHAPPVLRIQAFWAFALVALITIAFFVARTSGGLRLLAVGNDPDKARQMGVNPTSVRYWALFGTGLLCGLSGVMIMSNAGGFVDGMTAGRGFIALAALILGGWRPWPTLIACVLFGFLSALQIRLQGSAVLGVQLPPEAWVALPYVATLIALAGLLGKSRAPAGLGKP